MSKQSARRGEQRNGDRVTVAEGGRAPARGTIIAAWAGVAAYLAMFYWTPLTGAPLASGVVLRRWHLLMTALEPEIILADWLQGASWHAVPQRALVLAVAAAVLLVACAAGWICLRAARLDSRLTRLEMFVFSAGVGLNLVSLLTLALGLAGAMHWEIFAASGAAILLGAGTMAWRRGCRRTESGADAPAASGYQPPASLLWLGAPFVAAILLHSMLPPVDFDVREYHLQAPKEFYLSGQIAFLPHNVYANMPLGAEMLSLAGMIACGDWWTGALVGKTLIALFAPLTALVLLAAGRCFATPGAGIFAALLYISIPWVALVSMHGLIDGALGFYLMAALYAVLLWNAGRHSGGHGGARDARLLALAGFLAGGAVSTKYPAVLFCVLPLAAWIVFASLARNRGNSTSPPARSSAAKALGTFALFVVLGCGLWLAKNAISTGNPVYPLLYEVFGGRTRTEENDRQWVDAHDAPSYRPGDLAASAADVALESNWLSPLVTPLAVLGVLATRRRLTWWLTAYFGYVFVTWWFFTHRIDRFWVPALPVVALVAGIGATWTDARAWRVPFYGLLLFGLGSNFVTITSRAFGDNRYLADYAMLRVDPLRVNPWHLYLNRHANDVTGVLLVGDAQPFDLEVPAFYNTVFDDNLFEQLARGQTPEQIRQALAERHISHVYVDWSEMDRYRSPGNYGMTTFIEPDVFARLVKAGVLAKLPPIDDNPNEMYRVLPSSPKRADDGSPQ